jgi:hypothetical protein
MLRPSVFRLLPVGGEEQDAAAPPCHAAEWGGYAGCGRATDTARHARSEGGEVVGRRPANVRPAARLPLRACGKSAAATIAAGAEHGRALVAAHVKSRVVDRRTADGRERGQAVIVSLLGVQRRGVGGAAAGGCARHAPVRATPGCSCESATAPIAAGAPNGGPASVAAGRARRYRGGLADELCARREGVRANASGGCQRKGRGRRAGTRPGARRVPETRAIVRHFGSFGM